MLFAIPKSQDFKIRHIEKIQEVPVRRTTKFGANEIGVLVQNDFTYISVK